MISRPLIFRLHAVQRMFARRISVENVRQVLRSGELIEDYSAEMPHPGGLMLGRKGTRPLHVVVAEDILAGKQVVITVYEPDPSQWDAHFRSRRS